MGTSGAGAFQEGPGADPMSERIAPDAPLATGLVRLAASARWFPGRSRSWRPGPVDLLPWLRRPSAGSPGLRSAVLHIDYGDGDTERYHIPLSYRDEGTHPDPIARVDGWEVAEAVDDPGAMTALLECLAEAAPGLIPIGGEPPRGLPPRRFRGEQSNTSVFFGDALIAKIFRRLEPGRNLDVELHEVLADSGAVAALRGTWSHDGVDLGVFLEALPDPRDGFVVACDAARDGSRFDTEAHALGSQLAVIHALLGKRLPTGSTDGDSLAAVLRRRFDAACTEAPVLERFRTPVTEVFSAVEGLVIPTQRIHGDCHLGQALLTRGQWRYVDFEGEPLKTLDERRQPDSPWRDVAGMLRSFDYATHLGGGSEAWRTAARAAFLEGFGSIDDPGRLLLRAYEIDKAVYEVVYESRNRPDLVPVPVVCLTRIEH